MLSFLAQATTMMTASAAGATTQAAEVATATADEVLSPYVYVFYVAYGVAFCFTPIMRQIALYYGIIDEPDLVRKLHTSPVAYLGGIAVFLGWLAGLAISQFANVHRPDSELVHLRVPVAILVAAAMVVILGLWDDIHKVKPSLKIAVQIAAAIVLLYGGIGTHAIEPLLSPVRQRVELYYNWTPPWYDTFTMIGSGLLTVALVVFCCNATNLMDGLDGLCGGVTGIVAFGFVVLAVNLGMYGGGSSTNMDALRVVLGLALLGGVLGFVPYNFNPASIFMGDTGSMFLGFACAVMIVLMADAGSKWFLAAGVMFALPVLATRL